MFYQGEVYKGLEKKKLLHLDTNLVQPHYFYSILWEFPLWHICIFGPKL